MNVSLTYLTLTCVNTGTGGTKNLEDRIGGGGGLYLMLHCHYLNDFQYAKHEL